MVAQKSSQLLLQLQSRVLQWVNLNLSTVLECSELLKVQSLNHQHTTYKLMKPSRAGKVQQDAVAATLAELQLSGGSATSCSHVLFTHVPVVSILANTAKMLAKETTEQRCSQKSSCFFCLDTGDGVCGWHRKRKLK